MASMNGTQHSEETEVVSVPVEVYVRQDIYDSAMTTALSRGETLASVVRASYYAAAAAAEPVPDPTIRPRRYGDDRERVRFKVPAPQRTNARQRIEASGESVPAAIERYLRHYIEHGTIVGVAAPEPVTETSTTESE